MEVIYLLLSISVLIALAFLGAFIWSVKKGQYDDVVSPSIRILFDNNNNNNNNINNESKTTKTE
ncbi:MAG: hypothetical protein OHK0036_14170 [Bacteroidia bacterium]